MFGGSYCALLSLKIDHLYQTNQHHRNRIIYFLLHYVTQLYLNECRVSAINNSTAYGNVCIRKMGKQSASLELQTMVWVYTSMVYNFESKIGAQNFVKKTIGPV
jgi:hypothetical protein